MVEVDSKDPDKYLWISTFHIGLRLRKGTLEQNANSEDPDQPAHLVKSGQDLPCHLHNIGALLKIQD